jgi:predicted metal-binding protein
VSTLFVCTTCRREGDVPDGPRAGGRLHEALARELSHLDTRELNVVGVECLSNCQRGCSVAIAAPGKWTYIVGALDPDQHVGDVMAFARLHQASVDGLTVWRERPAHIRKNTIARVPPMSIAKEHS